jgi:hypothetical protein
MSKSKDSKLPAPLPGGKVDIMIGDVIHFDEFSDEIANVDLEWEHRDLLIVRQYKATFRSLRGKIHRPVCPQVL